MSRVSALSIVADMVKELAKDSEVDWLAMQELYSQLGEIVRIPDIPEEGVTPVRPGHGAKRRLFAQEDV